MSYVVELYMHLNLRIPAVEGNVGQAVGVLEKKVVGNYCVFDDGLMVPTGKEPHVAAILRIDERTADQVLDFVSDLESEVRSGKNTLPVRYQVSEPGQRNYISVLDDGSYCMIREYVKE